MHCSLLDSWGIRAEVSWCCCAIGHAITGTPCGDVLTDSLSVLSRKQQEEKMNELIKNIE
ncbi:hypothetical protein DAQ1742_01943 [Dickeya aquatica]|uniref:Uncharacterized protein n=1 Tax=Dickeya aquatica TaxID=1401087 RepID=A0A375A9Z3_9GAMM|nr:hypothetical protein DAQ1742_01943 [Dickeya aquatica]